MKVKIEKVVGSTEALRELARAQVGAILAFRIARLLHALEEPVAAFEAGRKKAVEQYANAEDLAKGGSVRLRDPELFQKALRDLLDVEVEISGEKIPEGSLIHPEIRLSAGTVLMLEWLIE